MAVGAIDSARLLLDFDSRAFSAAVTAPIFWFVVRTTAVRESTGAGMSPRSALERWPEQCGTVAAYLLNPRPCSIAVDQSCEWVAGGSPGVLGSRPYRSAAALEVIGRLMTWLS